MITLKYPWLLTLILLVPILWWAWSRRTRTAAIGFTSVARLHRANRSAKARFILPILRCLAIALLVLAIARPQKADEQTRVQTEGIAIQLVVDRSGSMGQEDFRGPEGMQSRLSAVKEVVRGFIQGDGGQLKGRTDDLVGLIDFAHYADTECPPTRDHTHLIRALEKIELPQTREEDGTAIGDALLLAVERIHNIGKRFEKRSEFSIKSRVIILLTDGEQNLGKYQPQQAADAAAKLGIKVYTIGVAPEYQDQQFGGLFGNARTMRVPLEINEKVLQQVADSTGGKYFRARDANALTGIYAQIDKLERSAIDETRYYLFEELAYKWAAIELHGNWLKTVGLPAVSVLHLPPILLVTLLLLAGELLLQNTRLRRIP